MRYTDEETVLISHQELCHCGPPGDLEGRKLALGVEGDCPVGGLVRYHDGVVWF